MTARDSWSHDKVGPVKRWLVASIATEASKFVDERPARSDRWGEQPPTCDFLTTILAAIGDLKDRHQMAVHVVGDFVRRRIFPLKERANPA